MITRTASLRLQLMDAVSGPAKKTSGALNSLEKDISKLGKNGAPGAKRLVGDLDHLRQKAAAVGRFQGMREGLRKLAAESSNTRNKIAEIRREINTKGSNSNLRNELMRTRKTLARTRAAFLDQASAARAAERGLKAFGLNSRNAISQSQTQIRSQMSQTIAAMRRMRTEARKPIPGISPMAIPTARAAHAAGGRTGRLFPALGGAAGGAYASGAILANPLKKALTYDETLTYIASTMAGEGSMEEKHQAKKRVSDAVDSALKLGGGSRDDAAAALNSLIASGAFQDDEALSALPAVVKTAHASGATSEDIANMAVGMRNNGVSVEDLQKGFDMAMRGGQLGSFELRDMARWFPQQLALARGAGLNGLDAVRQLVSLNQVSRTTSGTPDEAGNNLVNLLQKLNSRELAKTINETVQPEQGDPVTREEKIKGKGKNKRKVVTENFDWATYMVQRRQEGLSAVDALGEILDRQVGNNTTYKNAVEKLKNSNDAAEKQAWLDQATDIAENSAIGEIFADRQALMAALALRAEGERRSKIDSELGRADGSVERESQFVREQSWSKVQDAKNAADRANEQTFETLSGPLGDLAEKASEAAAAFPALTTAVYGLGTAMTALAAGGVIGGLIGGRIGSGGGRAGRAAALAAASRGNSVSNGPGRKAGIGRGGGAALGLGLIGTVASVAQIPTDRDEFKDFVEANSKRSDRWNAWLEKNVGTPRSWVGLKESASKTDSTKQKASLEADILNTTNQWPIAAQQGIRSYIGELMKGGSEAEAKAAAAGEQIKQALTVDGKLSIDTSQLDRAISLSQELAILAKAKSSVSDTPDSPITKVDNPRVPLWKKFSLGEPGIKFKAGVNDKSLDLMAATVSWPAAAQQGIQAYIEALSSGGVQAEAKASAIGEQIKTELSVTGTPLVDTSSLERALSLARQVSGAVKGIGGASVSAPSSSGGSLDPKLDGKRASGGPVKAGGVYQINEKGQELFAPGADGHIIPNHEVGGVLGGRGGGGMTVTVSAPISLKMEVVNGDPASIEAAIKRGVSQAASELEAKLARSLQTTFGNLAYGDA